MNTKIIAFFPNSSRQGSGIGATGRQEDGYILQVEGKIIESDLEDCASRDTDDYRLDIDEFPRAEGIYVFEGEAEQASEWDEPDYKGVWRKATAADLKGLIE